MAKSPGNVPTLCWHTRCTHTLPASAYTHWRGKLLKILVDHALPLEPDSQVAPQSQVVPGTVSLLEEAGHQVLAVVTGAGRLVIERLQLEGRKAWNAATGDKVFAYSKGYFKASWSPDGTRIASAGPADKQVSVWKAS